MEGPNDLFGDVYMNNIPNAPFEYTGLFVGGLSFGIDPPNKPVMHLNYGSGWKPNQLRGYQKPPELLTAPALLSALDWLHYQDTDTKVVFVNSTWNPGGQDSAGYVNGAYERVHMPKRGFDDLIVFGSADSAGKYSWRLTTHLGADTLHTITSYGLRYITLHSQYYLPRPQPGYGIDVNLSEVIDIDRDSVQDIVSFVTNNNVSYLYTIFGKRVEDSLWGVDTVVWQRLPGGFGVDNIKAMDFLRGDGIADLLISGHDTIFCYDGKRLNSIRSESFDFYKPDLAIPSPGVLDPVHWGNRSGNPFVWGGSGQDLGNVNGSGAHSIVAYGGWANSRETYMFIYSGGTAADERADAVVWDDGASASDLGGGITIGDTVQTGGDEPTGFLVGGPGYYGGQGLLWFFKGSTQIPHTPDPRWAQSVAMLPTEQNQLNVALRGGWLVAGVPKSSDGVLTLRNILGREVRSMRTSIGHDQYEMSLLDIPSGIYILEYDVEGVHQIAKVSYIKP